MSLELPDLFQPRNLLALGLAVGSEFALSWGTFGFALDNVPEASQNMSVVSLTAFALFFLLTLWLIVKIYGWIFLRKKPALDVDALRDAAEAEVGVGVERIRTPKE